MLKLETRKAYYEVLNVLKHMDKEYTSKISPVIIKTLRDNCIKDFNFEFNPQISLEKQNLSKKALSILALFDLMYWAERRR